MSITGQDRALDAALAAMQRSDQYEYEPYDTPYPDARRNRFLPSPAPNPNHPSSSPLRLATPAPSTGGAGREAGDRAEDDLWAGGAAAQRLVAKMQDLVLWQTTLRANWELEETADGGRGLFAGTSSVLPPQFCAGHDTCDAASPDVYERDARWDGGVDATTPFLSETVPATRVSHLESHTPSPPPLLPSFYSIRPAHALTPAPAPRARRTRTLSFYLVAEKRAHRRPHEAIPLSGLLTRPPRRLVFIFPFACYGNRRLCGLFTFNSWTQARSMDGDALLSFLDQSRRVLLAR
ncbi:hypothetical protein B0H17DRAFT_1339459 [Mycena rosella]|uniref:Uncharacterized protein n=1 Tax=Mycena rosella TaxID=1033263 RepID=A0AAD7C365_MYCRO|nr:hypothetical protein B0H17DRAFT_1339459 [Mycena rosella]